MEVNQLLQYSVQQNASDIHFCSNLPPQLRIDGQLKILKHPVLNHKELMGFLKHVLNEKQAQQFSQQIEIDFSCAFEAIARFRGHACHTLHGIKIILRVIPNRIPTLTDIAFPTISEQLIDYKQGLILVVGPTGSGKSTTLAALVHAINQRHCKHIITIEDPIEFIHNNQKSVITQREIATHTTDYQHALHAALRADPDVIVMGELRELTTIRTALTAAETGHLVLATLHTSTVPQTIHRLINAFPANEKPMVSTQLADVFSAVIAQRLLKQSQGGRKADWEILLANTAARHLIRENKIEQLYSIMQTHSASGMRLFSKRSY